MTAIQTNMMDYALRQDSRIRRGVIKTFIAENPLLQRTHVINVGDAEAYEYAVEGSLGTAQYRGIGEEVSPSSGIDNPAKETLAILSTQVQVDRLRANNNDYVAGRVDKAARRLSMMFMEEIFDGDTANSPKEMKGLNARIQGSNLYYASDENGANGANGGYLNLSLDVLREMIYSTRGKNRVLAMSPRMNIRLSQAVNAESEQRYLVVQADGGVSTLIPSFEQVPIVHILDNHLGAEILGFDEKRGSSEVTGSIYCLDLGQSEEEGINFLGNMGPNGLFQVDPLVSDGNTQRKGVAEGKVGMATFGSKCANRMAGILDAFYTA
ncbi:MAG: hypothetical protein H6826_14355 [Planctomycetes bacterium]|nr:hypothetical protein [Planctomycetota bacterium]